MQNSQLQLRVISSTTGDLPIRTLVETPNTKKIDIRRKFRSQTSDNMDKWKSRGGKSQRGEEKKKEDQKRERGRRQKMQVLKR
jgi:hypothetical protein